MPDTLESIWGPPKKEEGYDAQQIAIRLKGAGLQSHAIAGILGNIQQESGFKTSAKGDSGASVGLAQWQGPRRKALESFGGDQVDFLIHELNTDYKHALEKINTARSPEELSLIHI